MGGRQHHRVGARALELVHPRSRFVDSDRDRFEAGARGDQPVIGVARLVQRDSLGASRRERATDQTEALGVAVRHDDVLGIGDDAADAAEVVRQRRAQDLGSRAGRRN